MRNPTTGDWDSKELGGDGRREPQGRGRQRGWRTQNLWEPRAGGTRGTGVSKLRMTSNIMVSNIFAPAETGVTGDRGLGSGWGAGGPRSAIETQRVEELGGTEEV